jgi:pimeloyl-ACP methyl ester carboxylesterase
MIRAALTLAFVSGMAVASAHAASVDDVNIHWTSQGAGPQTLILVHCWTCDETAWSAQVPSLSRRYRVITLDLPGHGRSGTPAAFSIELFVRAIEAVRSEAGADRVVLAGHGNGAPVIRRYAMTHPERVAGLVVVDGTLLLAGNGLPPERVLRGMGKSAIREQAIRGAYFSETTTPDLQQRILKMMLAMPDAIAGDTLIAIQDPSQWTDEPVRVPVLAVNCAKLRSDGWERAIKRIYPMAEFHRIPDTGHFLMMENPEAFNRLVEGFLARVQF